MPDDLITHVELRVRKCTAEVHLNGIPIKRIVPTEAMFGSVPSVQYVCRGENRLEVVVFPGPEPARDREKHESRDAAEAMVDARLVSFHDGDFTGGDDGMVHAKIRWEGTGMTDVPVVLAASANDVPYRGPWAWESAPILSLSTDGPAIEQELRRLHTLFRDGGATDLLKSMETFLEETVRAYPAWNRTEVEAILLADIGRNAGKVDWVEPLDPARYSLRSCAGGRLVECVDIDWQPVIRTRPQPDGRMYPFPVFLGRTSKGLEILR